MQCSPRPSVHDRLVIGRACLEMLDHWRLDHGNPALGKAVEEWIIHCHLVELDLQEIDEQIRRVRRAS